VDVEGSLAVVLGASDPNTLLKVYDVSSPASPVLRSSSVVAPIGAGQEVALVSGRAYVAAAELGLKIYGLADPSAPSLVATVATLGEARDVGVDAGQSHAAIADSLATLALIALGG